MRIVNGSGRDLRAPSRWMPAVLALLALVAYGCGGVSGPHKPNQSPDLIFVDIPAGGTKFAANPTIYWYGTDLDGRIVRYDYAVIPETTVQQFVLEHPCSAGSTLAEKFIKCAPEEAFGWISIWVDTTVGRLPTNEKVRLYASFDTLDCDSEEIKIYKDPVTGKDTLIYDTVPINCVSKALPQYIFVRAIDDQDLPSPIKYRTYLRDNHWPETGISPDFKELFPYFSQPVLTETYKGIPIAWNGSDKSDFLREAPTLEYHWRVYGPYPLDPKNLRKPTLDDTLDIHGIPKTPAIESKSNDPRAGVWVKDTSAVLYNLWADVDRGQDTAKATRAGYFLFVVQARDDAFVSDPTPAKITFQAIFPKFERPLLIVDATAYNVTPYEYTSWKSLAADSIQAFLRRVAEWTVNKWVPPPEWGGGPRWIDSLDMWNRPSNAVCPSSVPNPFNRCQDLIPLVEMAKHKLVLYEDGAIAKDMAVDPDARVSLGQYLEVGGMVWLDSRVSLAVTEATGAEGLYDFFEHRKGAADDFAPHYLDMAGLWVAGWFHGFTQTPPRSNDQFAGMRSVPDPVGAPARENMPSYLKVDSLRLANTYSPLRATVLPHIVLGVPAVGYAVRWTDDVAGPVSRPLYTFDSYRPALGNYQDRIVGMRTVGPNLQNPKFKTAYFACPLWYFEEEQTRKLVEGMADWFLNEPIESGP